MPDVFLSYASADRERAREIASVFRQRGWSVWWDRTIPPGRTYDQVIEEALDASRCVVVLWTRNSVVSDWVKIEADEGARRGILVPVVLEEVRIPLAFRRIQAAHLIEWNAGDSNAELDLLLHTIAERLAEPAAPGSTPIVHIDIQPPGIHNFSTPSEAAALDADFQPIPRDNPAPAPPPHDTPVKRAYLPALTDWVPDDEVESSSGNPAGNPAPEPAPEVAQTEKPERNSDGFGEDARHAQGVFAELKAIVSDGFDHLFMNTTMLVLTMIGTVVVLLFFIFAAPDPPWAEDVATADSLVADSAPAAPAAPAATAAAANCIHTGRGVVELTSSPDRGALRVFVVDTANGRCQRLEGATVEFGVDATLRLRAIRGYVGLFTQYTLPPGRYFVSASHPGYHSASMEVSVERRRITTVTAVLVPR